MPTTRITATSPITAMTVTQFNVSECDRMHMPRGTIFVTHPNHDRKRALTAVINADMGGVEAMEVMAEALCIDKSVINTFYCLVQDCVVDKPLTPAFRLTRYADEGVDNLRIDMLRLEDESDGSMTLVFPKGVSVHGAKAFMAEYLVPKFAAEFPIPVASFKHSDGARDAVLYADINPPLSAPNATKVRDYIEELANGLGL